MSENKQKVLTKYAFDEIEDCYCGKPVFKYQNISTNVYFAKCANTKEEYDIKTRKWVVSKKQPCNLNCVFYGERPVFKEIKNETNFKSERKISLENNLRSLFRFLYISTRSTTIQEIDIIVQYTLKRQPRKIYYYPSIGQMRISHYESYEDYEKRIFSEKIVDRRETIKTVDIKPLKVIKQKQIKIKEEPLFVEIPEKDSDSDSNSDSESDSDTDSETSETSELSEVPEKETSEITELSDHSEPDDSEVIFEQSYSEVEYDEADDCDYTDE